MVPVMIATVYHSCRGFGRAAVTALCVLTLCLMLVPRMSCAQERTSAAIPPPARAFMPGETLTYEISWSNIVTAGTAVMEVKEETLPSGSRGFSGSSHRPTPWVWWTLSIPVNDKVESLFDPQIMQSLSFNLSESHGKKKRRRSLIFDHRAGQLSAG